MFNYDIIKKDWETNSKILTDEEIYELYKSEDILLDSYNKEVEKRNEYIKLMLSDYANGIGYTSICDEDSSMSKMLEQIFGKNIDDNFELRKKYLIKKEELEINNPLPKRKCLSLEKRNKVVEGTMDVVFNATDYYYSIASKNGVEYISKECLYYLFLFSSIKCSKNILHANKPLYRNYLSSSISNSFNRMLASLNNLSCSKIKDLVISKNIEDAYKSEDNSFNDLIFPEVENEYLMKPSSIDYMINKNVYYNNYEDIVSNDEFSNIYSNALNDLSDIERTVISLSYDINGYLGLTHEEIAEFTGLSLNNVKNTKNRARRKLRNNELLKERFKNIK